MGGVVIMARLDQVAWARSAKLKKSPSLNLLVEEIMDALLEMGGSAHRDAVIDRVAVHRGALSASDGLKRELLEAFEAHCGCKSAKRDQALLHLPFGDGSRRWALTPHGRQFAHDRQPSARSPYRSAARASPPASQA
jgi:hypothetical protein